ncbi:MAG TPA: hypothetical protein VF699_08725 [Caulobacteraceae bacterium]|jgi:hypothetical protein
MPRFLRSPTLLRLLLLSPMIFFIGALVWALPKATGAPEWQGVAAAWSAAATTYFAALVALDISTSQARREARRERERTESYRLSALEIARVAADRIAWIHEQCVRLRKGATVRDSEAAQALNDRYMASFPYWELADSDGISTFLRIPTHLWWVQRWYAQVRDMLVQGRTEDEHQLPDDLSPGAEMRFDALIRNLESVAKEAKADAERLRTALEE